MSKITVQYSEIENATVKLVPVDYPTATQLVDSLLVAESEQYLDEMFGAYA